MANDKERLLSSGAALCEGGQLSEFDYCSQHWHLTLLKTHRIPSGWCHSLVVLPCREQWFQGGTCAVCWPFQSPDLWHVIPMCRIQISLLASATRRCAGSLTCTEHSSSIQRPSAWPSVYWTAFWQPSRYPQAHKGLIRRFVLARSPPLNVCSLVIILWCVCAQYV